MYGVASNRVRDERLSAHDYFRVALAVLGEVGSEGLTIAVLCDRLSVTKGSFYHHFGGLPGFVDQLLRYWESEHSERLIAMSRAQPDPALRMGLLIDIAVSLPHESEAAIRAWARSNPDVSEVIARVDRRRERHLVDSLVALGLDRARARSFARMALNLLVGAQMRGSRVDLRQLRHSFDELNRLIFAEADPEMLAHLEQHEAG